MSVLIFANGDIDDLAWISPYFEQATAVIGVDGGTHHVINAGKWPDMVIGDLDSISSALLKNLHDRPEISIKKYPREKNETDLELALMEAATSSLWLHEEVLVFGVTGGRLDQTIGNIFLLAHEKLAGRTIKFVSQYQMAWLIAGSTKIAGQAGDIISLLPMGGDCSVDYTNGLRWDLYNETLRFGPARGVSNELTAETAEVVLKSGTLLCIHTKKEWQR